MGLKLQTVPAAMGLRWVRQGFTQFFRHPMAFAMLLMLFMIAAMLMAALPFVGVVLVMMAVPLLSLAFMHATHESLQGRMPRTGVLWAMWKKQVPQERRRALLSLCLGYALATLVGLTLCEAFDGGALDRFMDAVGRGADDGEVTALGDDPAILSGVVARLLVTVLLGIPMWHAPALVLWGGQGVGQALFSSTLAVWRSRNAFLLYGLGWTAAVVGGVLGVSLLLMLLGQSGLMSLLVMPMALLVSTAYYVSLYFTFIDSFGRPDSH